MTVHLRTSRTSTLRKRAAQFVLLMAGTVLALVGAALPAAADSGGSGGWVRLAHLSPDTPSVNVALTNVSDSRAVLKLSDVGYGAVSAYTKVPAGRYVATMTPPGGTAASTPAVSQAVTVQNGRAYTVAAIGTNAQLTGTVIEDDLRTPKPGQAKIRLIQAAVSAATATVTAVDGPVLARDAAFGSVTGYAAVPEGVWTIQVTPSGGQPIETKVTARPGTVNTIVLLDKPSGQLTTTVLRDAAAAPAQPKKGTGVQTGGGGTATEVVGGSVAGRAWGVAVLAAVAATAGLALARSRRAAGPPSRG